MLQALYRLILGGLVNDRIRFLHTSKEGDLWMLIFNLFHSIIVDGKRNLKGTCTWKKIALWYCSGFISRLLCCKKGWVKLIRWGLWFWNFITETELSESSLTWSDSIPNPIIFFSWGTFNPLMLVVTKRSHRLKQTCSWKLQVCLSLCDLFVTTRH